MPPSGAEMELRSEASSRHSSGTRGPASATPAVLDRKDAAAVRRLAHALRGSCLNLGALHMTEVASALERAPAREPGRRAPCRPARGGVPAGRDRARHPPRAGPDVVKILLADDDAAARMALGELLEHAGHEVVTAAGGLAAWAVLQNEYFPLVLLDRVMPDLDGIELCRRIRARRQPRYTYVMLVTMVGGGAAYLEGMNAGADDYFGDPFDPEELRARLQVAERGAEPAGGARAPGDCCASAPTARPSATSTTPGYRSSGTSRSARPPVRPRHLPALLGSEVRPELARRRAAREIID